MNNSLYSRGGLSGFCAVICSVVLMLLMSCAPKEAVRLPEGEPFHGQVDVELLKRSAGFKDIKSIKALTDIRVYKHGDLMASLNGVFGYKTPDFIRTSFFGPFGLTVMDMLITEKLLQVHLPSKGVLYEMNSPGISFSPMMDDKFSYIMQTDGDYYLLDAFYNSDKANGPVIRYFFDRTYLLNRKIVVFRDGQEFITVEFDRFNGKTPEMARLVFAKGFDMEIIFREPEYDSTIPDDYFRKIDHDSNKILPFQDLLKRFAPSR